MVISHDQRQILFSPLALPLLDPVTDSPLLQDTKVRGISPTFVLDLVFLIAILPCFLLQIKDDMMELFNQSICYWLIIFSSSNDLCAT